MTMPSVSVAYPASGATGVVLADPLYVIFDKEVDPTSVQVLLEGPDTDRWSGPSMVLWDDPTTTEDDDMLASPGFQGLVPGTMTLQRVDSEGDVIPGVQDYTGGGSNWRSKVIFTTENPLAPSTEYTVYIFGDEDDGDDIESGVSTRTVFDTVKGANIGDADVYFYGGYTGTIDDTFYVEAQQTGDAGDGLHFHWWKASNSTRRVLDTKLQNQFLTDGVYVRFYGDLVANDAFSVVVRPAERMTATYRWTFTTGSGSIQSLPSTVADDPSVPVAATPTGVSGGTTGFRVISVTPAERATNLVTADISTVVIQFSASLDKTTITDDTVTIKADPVNGDDTSIESEGELAKTLSVSGDTLTIQIG